MTANAPIAAPVIPPAAPQANLEALEVEAGLQNLTLGERPSIISSPAVASLQGVAATLPTTFAVCLAKGEKEVPTLQPCKAAAYVKLSVTNPPKP